MKKNNKGFTLVELLAALVIMGILFGIGLPAITGMLYNNRNKIYVSDAKKLASLAEKTMNSKSSEIDKPKKGDCIVMSLNYLDNADFDNPPNKGTYLRYSSFVVIKNNDGDLEYSVNLIERYKGAYKGIELTSVKDLKSNNATSLVKTFKKSDLVSVDGVDGFDNINKEFINSKIDSDVSAIETTYNYSDVKEYLTGDDDFSIPSIKAVMSSTSGKLYNSLDATLSIEIIDDDTLPSNIKLYYSVNKTSTNTFPDPATSEGYTYCEKNADCDAYLINFKLNEIGFTYGNIVYINILAVDSDGNTGMKRVIYDIHKNTAPVITDISVKKHPDDSYNLHRVVVKANISDDIDDTEKLSVCIKEKDSSSTCSPYKPYKEVFNDYGETDINLCPANNCFADGSTKTIQIFVKDTSNLIANGTGTYTLHANKAPEITMFNVDSDYAEFVPNGKKSLTAIVELYAKDDLTSNGNLTYTINQKNGTSVAKTVSGKFNTDGEARIVFPLTGTYDGKDRVLEVVVKDSYNGEVKSTTKTYTYGNVYKNTAPVIQDVNINGSEVLGLDGVIGLGNPGSLKTNLSFDIYDDIDLLNNIKICYSIDKSYCDSTSSRYTEYSKVSKSFEFENKKTRVYDGSEKKLYVRAMDSYGAISSLYTADYILYENEKPSIISAEIDSLESRYSDLNTSISLNISDDITPLNKLEVTITGGTATENKNGVTGKYTELFSSGKLKYKVSDKYDGEDKTIKIEVKDEYGDVNDIELDYSVFGNDPPNISEFNVISDGYPCNANMDDFEICSLDEGNSYNYVVNLSADDAFDNQNDLKICISDNSDYCNNKNNFTTYSEVVKKTLSNIPELKYSVKDDVRKIYLSVMDTFGEVKSTSVDYSIYYNKAPVILEESKVQSRSGYSSNSYIREHSNDFNTLDIDYIVTAKDDFDADNSIQQKICYKKNDRETCGEYGTYHKTTTMTLPGVYDGSEFEIYSYLKDTYGFERKVSSVNYTVSDNEKPSIINVEIESNGTACSATILDSDNNHVSICPVDSGGSYNFIASVSVYDDLDSINDLKLCVSNDENHCKNKDNFFGYTNSYTLSLDNFNHRYTQDEDEITIYVYVMDSLGSTDFTTLDYKVYKNIPPVILNGYPRVETTVDSYYDIDTVEEIKNDYTDLNVKKIKYSVKAVDDFDSNESLTQQICYEINKTTNCSEYTAFKEENIVEIQGVSYNGSEVKIYSNIKDTDGRIATTSKVYYQLYEDREPELLFYVVEKENDIAYNQGEFDFGFVVKDLFDQYRICISETEDKCTNFSDYYDGGTFCSHKYRFKFNNWDYTKKDANNEKKFYVTIEDKNGHKVSKSLDYRIFKVCDEYTDYDGIISDNDTAVVDGKLSGYYNYCSYRGSTSDQLDVNVSSTDTYVFKEKASHELDDSIDGNEKLSANKCGGKCFNSGEDDAVSAKYFSINSYYDMYFENILCSSEKSSFSDDLYCDYKDCYYNSKFDNYENYVIGTTLFAIDDEDENATWTYIDENGVSNTYNNYYLLYISSYDEDSDEIKLTPTTTKIPPNYEDYEMYKFRATDDIPYLIAEDGE